MQLDHHGSIADAEVTDRSRLGRFEAAGDDDRSAMLLPDRHRAPVVGRDRTAGHVVQDGGLAGGQAVGEAAGEDAGVDVRVDVSGRGAVVGREAGPRRELSPPHG
jgi:hypothetical protein